jgi:hypothetical protein
LIIAHSKQGVSMDIFQTFTRWTTVPSYIALMVTITLIWLDRNLGITFGLAYNSEHFKLALIAAIVAPFPIGVIMVPVAFLTLKKLNKNLRAVPTMHVFLLSILPFVLSVIFIYFFVSSNLLAIAISAAAGSVGTMVCEGRVFPEVAVGISHRNP